MRMMIKKQLITLLVVLTCVLKGMTQEAYFRKYNKVAEKAGHEYGIPKSVILAIAMVESGGGNSRNCKLLNNHFGIRGKNNVRKTHKVRTGFKQYPSALASYEDFCQLMSRKKFYNRLKGVNDHTLWVNSISRTGYSSHPAAWRRRIIGVIEKYKL
jgi:Bax protein